MNASKQRTSSKAGWSPMWAAPLAMLLLGSCSGPVPDYLIVANSGVEQISFRDCKGQERAVRPGANVVIEDSYLPFSSHREWHCFARRDLVIATESGTQWRYRLGFNARDAESNQRHDELRQFTRAPAHPRISTYPSSGFNPFFAVNITRFGDIEMGHWVLDDDTISPDVSVLATRELGEVIEYYDYSQNRSSDLVLTVARLHFSPDKQPQGFPLRPMAAPR